jgi:hypothetical protein
MDKKTKRRFGIFIFAGLLIGALFGMLLGAGSANLFLGIGGGALIGASIGWFIAAADMEIAKEGLGPKQDNTDVH